MKTPFVSVIIPVRNEAASIGRALDSILDGDYPAERMEAIVADGMSTDGTREIVAGYAARERRVKLIDNPEKVTPAALNRAIDAARGEVIARVDAHARVAHDYLSQCVRCLLETGAWNVGGTMRTLGQSEGPFSEAILAAMTHRFGVGNSYFRIGGALGLEEPRWVDTVFGGCWPREVFDRVGRFNERLARSQDMEFSLRLKRAGGRTLLVPEIRSDYYARSDLASFIRHNFWNGEWAVVPFLYSEVIPVSVRHLVPLAFVAALIAGAVASAWSWWPLGIVAIPYTIVNLISSVQAAWRAKRASLLARLPVTFAALHVSYGLGSMWGVIRVLAELVRRANQARAVQTEEISCLPRN